MRPLGDDTQVTERWSTRSRACSAHEPKTNFSLKDVTERETELGTRSGAQLRPAAGFTDTHTEWII